LEAVILTGYPHGLIFTTNNTTKPRESPLVIFQSMPQIWKQDSEWSLGLNVLGGIVGSEPAK
jgi:hypothetical protein